MCQTTSESLCEMIDIVRNDLSFLVFITTSTVSFNIFIGDKQNSNVGSFSVVKIFVCK